MRPIYFVLTLCLFSSLSANAGNKPTLPKADDMVKITGVVKLRDSSPDPSFGGKGAQIGWLKADEVAKVLGVKHYISIFGTEIWLEIVKENDSSVKGWIFAGLAKDVAGGNSSIELLDAEPQTPAETASAKTDGLVDNIFEIHR